MNSGWSVNYVWRDFEIGGPFSEMWCQFGSLWVVSLKFKFTLTHSIKFINDYPNENGRTMITFSLYVFMISFMYD